MKSSSGNYVYTSDDGKRPAKPQETWSIYRNGTVQYEWVVAAGSGATIEVKLTVNGELMYTSKAMYPESAE